MQYSWFTMLLLSAVRQSESVIHILCSVAQSCPILCFWMNCSPPDSSVHEVFQARSLEWVAISSSRGSSWSKDWTCVSCIGRQIFYHWASWEVLVIHILTSFKDSFPIYISLTWLTLPGAWWFEPFTDLPMFRKELRPLTQKMMEMQNWVGCPLRDILVRNDSETLLWVEQARVPSRGHSSVEKAALGPQRLG